MGELRQRDREGWIELDTRSSPARWVGYTYTSEQYTDAQGVVRYRKERVPLGTKTKDDLPTRSAALDKWRRIRGSLTTPAAPLVKDGNITFKKFLKEQFVPLKRGGWNDATRDKLEYWFGYMNDSFGDEPLSAIEPKRLAGFLEQLAGKHCGDTVVGCLTYMRAIFEEAVDQDYLNKNPAKKLKPPKGMRERDRTTRSLPEIAALEKALHGRDHAIFALFCKCGPRAAEAFAGQWQDLRENRTLLIARTYSKFRLKKPKTDAAKDTIVLPESLYQELLALKDQSDDPSSTGWIFPASRKRKGELMCLDYHNWLGRNLKPVADKLGIKVNHQILRRTFATLANDAGGDLKSVQRQLRHAKVSTTADIYTQAVPEAVRDTVEALDEQIRTAARKRAGKTGKKRP